MTYEIGIITANNEMYFTIDKWENAKSIFNFYAENMAIMKIKEIVLINAEEKLFIHKEL